MDSSVLESLLFESRDEAERRLRAMVTTGEIHTFTLTEDAGALKAIVYLTNGDRITIGSLQESA